ncbi:MAG: neutral/alkaline non-lysosomal ceramidase N-terminal domain-containing protein [Candidatus Omnitrophica bacterium]|nr:neutral/alkaline non-lysosomal ceramidase N-terminal domain-containing protein [Candidatus Omnitrophota bacterium]
MRYTVFREFHFFLASAVLVSAISGCISVDKTRVPPFQQENLARLEAARHLINVKTNGTEAGLKAGTSKIEITPPIGTPLAGFGRRKGGPSTGALNPLWARALVLDDGKDVMAFVSLDMMAVHKELFFEALRQIDPALNIGQEDLFLMASHTHSGSGGLTDRWVYERVSGEFSKDLFYETALRITEAVHAAFRRREPVRLLFASKSIAGFSRNRMTEGAAVDAELFVLRVDNIAGGPKALLINFAAHPTILGSSNFKFSGDFPGHAAAYIETEWPDTVCLFSNGAAADVKPRTVQKPSDYEESVEFGERLAREAIQLSGAAKQIDAGGIASIGVTAQLPPVRIHWKGLSVPNWLGKRFFDRETILNSARIGDFVFFGIPGELQSKIGLDVKSALKENGLNAVILGYTNDYIAYILNRDAYRADEYEAEVSFYGSELGRFMQELILEEGKLLKEAYP